MTDQSSPASRAVCRHPLHLVLIGTSLEAESDQVVRSGLAVARAAGARVHLVHAARMEPSLPVGFGAALGPDFLEDQITWRKEQLAQQVERLGISTSELAGTGVLAGAPHRVLSESARSAGADLIVVGATGAGPLAAELLGSTADRVLRTAECPVLVVRGELPVPPLRVLVPVDLSPLSDDAFRCGLDLLGQLTQGGATRLKIVHALSFLDALARERQRQKTGEISFEHAERVRAEELQQFALENRVDASFQVETAVLPGEARFEILRELGEHPADLVMIGTHGHGGLDRLVLGSVASTVARRAPCSVLLISPAAAFEKGSAAAETGG